MEVKVTVVAEVAPVSFRAPGWRPAILKPWALSPSLASGPDGQVSFRPSRTSRFLHHDQGIDGVDHGGGFGGGRNRTVKSDRS
jgi:hypothetical protein